MTGHTLIARLSGLVALLLSVAGCAAVDAGPAKGVGSTASLVPSNYRQLVARYIAANVSRGQVLKAEISQPGVWAERWDGPHPIACVRWRAQGPLIQQNFALGFIFRNGQIVEAFNPEYANPAAGGYLGAALLNAVTCGKLAYSPFPEMMSSR